MALAFLLLFLLPSTQTQTDKKPVEQAWSILQSGLEDKSADKRTKATHALGLLPNNQKAESMAEKALGDTSPEVRTSAANALGSMKATGAKERLEQALKDNDVRVAVAAANALYTMSDPAAYEVYYAILTGERKTSGSLLQSQLNRFKDRKQLEKLVFQTGIGFVPFGGMSYQAWETITHDDASPVRAAAALKLARDPDPKSAQALVKMCYDKSWQVRLAVVDAISERGDPALVDSVMTLMWDDSDAVRLDAAAAVVSLEEIKLSTQEGRRREKRPARKAGR